MVGFRDYVDRYLLECRDSLRDQDYPKDLMNVYIIDNCSINNCAFIKENFPEAKFAERQDGNYAAANNLGLKMAMDDGCDYFVIANMDTKFSRSWISELVKAMKSDSKIGIAQSKMLLYPKNEEEWKVAKINSLGNIMHFLGFGFTSGYGEADRQIEGYPEIKGYASGCSYITSREVLDKIGLYDEEYWMYHDDIEMSWRVKLAGYKIVLAPKSVMYHKYEFSRSVRMLYYMERNRYLVMFQYYRLPTLLLLAPAILGMELGMIAFSIANGWFKDTKLKVLGYFFRLDTWRKIFAKRKEVAKFRAVNDGLIVRHFEGRVLFQEIENPILKYIANPIFDMYWRIARAIIFW